MSNDEPRGAPRGANDPIGQLTALLKRLPGVGEKSAMRLALSLVRGEREYAQALGDALRTVHDRVRTCEVCEDLCAGKRCSICGDARRDEHVICVVAQPQDRIAFERSGVFRGRYHVLHGVLDPLSGTGPNELRIASLLARLRDSTVREVIVATSPNVEGDATALYLSRLIQPLGIEVTRIAAGLAVGGEVEYADLSTLSRALDDRRKI